MKHAQTHSGTMNTEIQMHELNAPRYPVRIALEKLQTLDTVRIIEGTTSNHF